MENEKINLSNKVRKKIADAVKIFYKTRLNYSQEIIASQQDTITLEEYIQMHDDILKEFEVNSPTNEKTVDFLINSKGEKIIILEKYYKEFHEKKLDLRNKYSRKIVLDPIFINDLNSIVHESIMKYGLSHTDISGEFSWVIQDAIENYKEHLQKSQNLTQLEEYKKTIISKANYILYGDKSECGIDLRVNGFATINSGEFEISDAEEYTIFAIDLNGNDKMNTIKRKGHENIFLSKDLFVRYTDLIEIKQEDDREKMQIVYGWCMPPFTLDDSSKIEYIKKYNLKTFNINNELDVIKLDDYFKLYGLSFLYEDIYKTDDIKQMIYACKKWITMPEEEKENLNHIIDIATNWWANALQNPQFNNGGYFDYLANDIRNNTKYTDEQIINFKKHLHDEILKGIITRANNVLTLRVDYGPDEYLLNACHKANIDADIVSFPWKTNMYITDKKICVNVGYQSEEETIYDTNDKDKILNKKI